MEQPPPNLSDLLTRVQAEPTDHEARIQAARLALALAFHKGDPHFADIAEALLVDAPRRLPAPARATLRRLAAQAHAIRRAVAIAHQEARATPSALIRSLSDDPEALVVEVRALLASGRGQLARAVLEVSIARHPGHSGLMALADLALDPWPDDDTAP
ncbi:MAG: hypothetical protein ABIO70_05395 [Pseudomonadota bacterium]